MTTINDRYRLALQQLQPNTNRKVLTALGASAYASQVRKLSRNILQDFHNNQVKVVVLESAVSQLDDEFGTIQTYTEWFEELRILSNFGKINPSLWHQYGPATQHRNRHLKCGITNQHICRFNERRAKLAFF